MGLVRLTPRSQMATDRTSTPSIQPPNQPHPPEPHRRRNPPGIQNSVLFVRGLKRMRPGYAWDEAAGGWARRTGSEKHMQRAGVVWDAAGDAFPAAAQHDPQAGRVRGGEVAIGDAEGVLLDEGEDEVYRGGGGGGRRRRGKRGRGRGRGRGLEVGGWGMGGLVWRGAGC